MSSNSEKILLALLKHGRLNYRQIANNISEKTVPTINLLNLMFCNGKLQADGRIDDQVAYSLTPKGRMAVEKNSPPEPPPSLCEASDSLPRSLEDLAFPPSNRQPVRPAEFAKQEDPLMAMEHRAGSAVAVHHTMTGATTTFGRLNSGELIFMQGDTQIVLSASLVPQLRNLLQGSPA